MAKIGNPFIDAVVSIRPGASFSFKALADEEPGQVTIDYDHLDWLDATQQKPTLEEVESEIQKQENELYKEQRAAEYPPLTDLADAVYWQEKGDTSKMAAYVAAVEAIKQKYPKP